MKKWIYTIVALSVPVLAEAQCAMCKAVVESNASANENLAGSVNDAIIYLMGIPYLLVMVVGIAWYRKFGKQVQR